MVENRVEGVRVEGIEVHHRYCFRLVTHRLTNQAGGDAAFPQAGSEGVPSYVGGEVRIYVRAWG